MSELCILRPGDKIILMVGPDYFLLQMKKEMTVTDENKALRCNALALAADMIEAYYSGGLSNVCNEWGLRAYSSFSVDSSRTLVLLSERPNDNGW